MGRKSSLLKDHVVTLRLSEDEYNFVQSQVDFFYFDSASMFLRSLIRESMDEERKRQIYVISRRENLSFPEVLSK